MSEYKAIALDMDGTLLTRDHQISSATRAALAQARAHGIKVLLVTGRHFMTARPFHHELALDTPLICSNGAYLYDPAQGRILAGDPLAVAPLTVASVNAARNRLLATLNHAADHDALTGTLNRSAFLRRGRELAEHAQRTGGTVVAMMLDIDHFKSVNDRFGHACGDECLREVSTALRSVLSEADMFGRYGGEEFIAVLPGRDGAEARAVGERMRTAVENCEVRHEGQRVRLTVSIGLAALSPLRPYLSPQALMQAADEALYIAKHTGRDRLSLAA